MAANFTNENPDLEALFRKYESAPDSYVFAPLADAYRKSGMLEEAVEICRKGLRKHPEYPSGHVVQGKCHFDVGALDEAEESFKRVLELDENNLVALKFLGMIQAGRGLLDSAGEYFKHILVLDPENREIKGMLEDIESVEVVSGPQKKAGRGQADAADDAKTEDAGGDRGRGMGDDDFEGDPITLGEVDSASDDLATMTLADIYAAQGFPDKAARIYREVLKRQPDNTDVRKKLAHLDGDSEFSELDAPTPPREDEPVSDARPKVLLLGADDASSARESESLRLDDEEPEVVEPKDAPIAAGARTGKKARKTPPAAAPLDPAQQMDDKKSYDQFKRWIKNMQD